MSGRATGRARGRPPHGDSPPTSGSSPTGSGSPTADISAANRGRGGYGLVVTRPEGTKTSVGEGGRPVNLFANYFQLQTNPQCEVWDFRVDFEPPVESVKVRRLLVNAFANRFVNRDGKPSFIFDGRSNLKSVNPLDPHRQEVTMETQNPAAVDAGEAPMPQKVIFKRSQNPVSWGSMEMMRLYNTQMRRNFEHLGWLLVYRDYYNPATKIEMPAHSIDVMLGLTTAINQHDGGILMACDTINKIIRRDTVLQVMRGLHSRGPAHFHEACKRELNGAIVMTIYNNKTYKISDIDFSKNPSHTFECRGRGLVSLMEYYHQQYQREVTDVKQPLIVCLPTKREQRNAELRGQTATTQLLIPEFCVMTGLSDSLRSNFDLKKQLTQATQLPPAERFRQLNEFRRSLEQNPNIQEDLRLWDLKYSIKPVELTGRVLENEKLIMGGQKVIPIQAPGDFSRDMRSSRLLEPRTWTQWAVLYPNRESNTCDDFLNALKTVCGPLGLSLQAPKKVVLQDDRSGTYVRALDELKTQATGMVVCLLPNNTKDRYDAIKRKCCIETPCASQCILTRTLSKKPQLLSVATKVCLQMAVKAGSQAWGVEIPAKNTMVIGYDTYHDGARRGESVGAFVCSLNAHLTQYYSRVSYHSKMEEMSANIAANFKVGLIEYQKRNGGKMPDRVVMFRDGVGDGMVRHVFEIELEQMKRAIIEAGGSETKTKLAFIIVTKRINTKFFLKNEQTRALENPPPGLIVDTVVTRPERLEFYLVAQSVRAGTVAPTSFNVIYNSVGWLPKHFQMLSYKLCHTYFNWPGTIRVPAPCQYAHKLAFLTGTALHREPDLTLADRLFYL